MGVNYYMTLPDGTPDETRHLGKWASGEFTARAYRDRGIVDRASWEAQLASGLIVDECNVPATVKEMTDMTLAIPRWGRRSTYRTMDKDHFFADGMWFTAVEFF
jgi:hypothetical protein